MLPPGLGLAAYEGLRFGVCFEGVAMHVQVRRGPSHLHACVCLDAAPRRVPCRNEQVDISRHDQLRLHPARLVT